MSQKSEDAHKEGKEDQEKALVPLQVSQIDFYGDVLQVVLVEVNGDRLVLVPLRQFCQHLGVDWASQYQRIQRDEVLAKEMMTVVLTTTVIPVRGQRQSYPALCLPLDLLPGWLFTISPTRVKPELRESIQRYRGQCYRVLWKAFLQGELFPKEEGQATVIEAVAVPSGVEPIDALTEQINTLTAIVAFLQEHRRALLEEAGQAVSIVEAGQQELLQRADQLSIQLTYVSSLLEQLLGRQGETEGKLAKIEARTQRLTPAHARNVQGMVERIVRESERRNAKGLALTHAHVYGRLKTYFRAGKFDEIPDERYETVEEFLREMLPGVIGGEEPKQGSLF